MCLSSSSNTGNIASDTTVPVCVVDELDHSAKVMETIEDNININNYSRGQGFNHSSRKSEHPSRRVINSSS